MYIGKNLRRYYLARMPGTGCQHDPACPSFDVPDANSGRGASKEAIREEEDGTVVISLSTPLSRVACLPITDQPATLPAGGTQSRQNSITLLGLLHYLWESAEFNRWYVNMRGKRSWYVVRKHILSAAENVHIKHHCLAKRLYMPEQFDKNKVAEHTKTREDFFRQICGADSVPCRDFMVVIAYVGEITPSVHGFRITLKHMPGVRLWMDETVGISFHKTFARELLTLGDNGGDDRLVGIFVVDRTKGGNYMITDGALMRVTKHWIPVESRYEATIANSLVDQGRAFIKPLRYDADQDAVFPDFYLLDCGDQPVPIEVHGFSGNLKYEQRKQEKIQHYQRQGENYWHWEVCKTGSGSWPPFPEPFSNKHDTSLCRDGLPLHGD